MPVALLVYFAMHISCHFARIAELRSSRDSKGLLLAGLFPASLPHGLIKNRLSRALARPNAC